MGGERYSVNKKEESGEGEAVRPRERGWPCSGSRGRDSDW